LSQSISSDHSHGDHQPGVVIEGRYRIVRELGRGGMGTVYEAEQIKLQKQVALKVLHADRVQRDDRGASLKRFLREARAASSIQHRNVVTILDFGDLEDGSAYYVMELLPGRDLSTVLKSEGAMAWPRVRSLLRQVLSGLGAAHEQGIVHRDIKPANIVRLDDPDELGNEWVKVLDFGIAKIQHMDQKSQTLTGASELLGTPAYMAPELVRGGTTDRRADLYAVGVLAYQLLTGELPFRGENTFQVLFQHVNEPPKPPRALAPHLSPAIDALVLRAMAKDPADRYQTTSEMIRALDELGDSPPAGDTRALVGLLARPWASSGSRRSSSEGRTTAAKPIAASEASTVVTERSTGAPIQDPSSRTRRSWPLVALVATSVVGIAVASIAWSSMNRDAMSPPAAPEPDPSAAVEVEPEIEPAPPPAPSPRSDTVAPADVAPPPATSAGIAEPDPGSEPSASSGPPDEGVDPVPPAMTKAEGARPAKRCETYECRQQRAERQLRQRAANKCRSLAKGDEVTVKLTIGTDGKALMPRALPPHEASALGRCVVDVAAQASFPTPERLTPRQLRIVP
jgi:serine/threonine protein kinase